MKLLDFNKHRKLHIKHFDTMMSFERFLEQKTDSRVPSKLNEAKQPEIVSVKTGQADAIQSIQILEHNYSDA